MPVLSAWTSICLPVMWVGSYTDVLLVCERIVRVIRYQCEIRSITKVPMPLSVSILAKPVIAG